MRPCQTFRETQRCHSRRAQEVEVHNFVLLSFAKGIYRRYIAVDQALWVMTIRLERMSCGRSRVDGKTTNEYSLEMLIRLMTLTTGEHLETIYPKEAQQMHLYASVQGCPLIFLRRVSFSCHACRATSCSVPRREVRQPVSRLIGDRLQATMILIRETAYKPLRRACKQSAAQRGVILQ